MIDRCDLKSHNADSITQIAEKFMGAANFRWRHNVPEWYKPLESVKGWKKCGTCKEFPRIWQFNNGNDCKCCCSEFYGQPEARAESVLSWVSRHGGSAAGYDGLSLLRGQWNLRCETGDRQINLPDGQW